MCSGPWILGWSPIPVVLEIPHIIDAGKGNQARGSLTWLLTRLAHTGMSLDKLRQIAGKANAREVLTVETALERFEPVTVPHSSVFIEHKQADG